MKLLLATLAGLVASPALVHATDAPYHIHADQVLLMASIIAIVVAGKTVISFFRK